jgi:lipoprotein-releasing system ATP-binding protein
MVILDSVGKFYKNGPEELHILNNISMTLEKGKTVVVTGESGSGKSTLLNLIGGLDYPSYGTILVEELQIDSAGEEKLSYYRNRQVGFIFQFHYLMKDFNARENVMLPAFMGGERRSRALERADLLLDQVGLENRKEFHPSQLSGGERQRVAVARALINSPKIVLADEPTGNLDERHSKVVADMLFELAEQYNTTLVVVTHDMSLSEKADTHFHLREGRLEVQ